VNTLPNHTPSGIEYLKLFKYSIFNAHIIKKVIKLNNVDTTSEIKNRLNPSNLDFGIAIDTSNLRHATDDKILTAAK
jgi:hypothetical protein